MEKGRTRQCAMSEGKCRIDEEKEVAEEEEEGTAPRCDGGDEKERGVRRGELPATRSPSIPR